MDKSWQTRTELVLGANNLEILSNAHVLVAGLGGVGSYAAEQLVRAGIGQLTIADGDTVHNTNRNRQLPALLSTIGKRKTAVMAERLLDINPSLKLHIADHYLKDQTLLDILEPGYDFVVDAIDTLAPKVYLIYHSQRMGLPLVSSMGAGGKYDPLQIKAVDIAETNNCRLAYYIRKKLHKLDVWTGFTAVYSPETVSRSAVKAESGEFNKRSTVGTISYMPAMFGCVCASVVIRKLTGLT
jgi:tRNA A37 threonylcarbamoyladenosine dehydratase